MMIAFFLTPKADVAWVSSGSTLRQAIERMEHHRYTAVPLIASDGTYAGTLTEGDLLWYMKQHPQLRFEDTERVPLAEVARRITFASVHIDAEIETLLSLALEQNFVPVVDDRGAFIGIVRRSSILRYFQSRILASMRTQKEG
jgi:CBS domain-containing protein